MREDTKSGTRLCLEVKVVQDMGGTYTHYYRTNGTIDSWDEEYIIYDYREESKPKIIEGDKIKIYGEFLELGKFERSLTGTTVEIPIVYAKYIEFPDLEKPTSTPKPTATPKPTPIPCNVEFNQSGEIFSSYDWDGNVEGSARIDSISYTYDDLGWLYVYFHGQIIEKNEDFYIRYKLFDSDDCVIDNGIVILDGLEEGDKFKNKFAWFYDIEAGNYRIELSDY